MDALKSLSPCELIVLATLIAFAVCEGQDADDLNILGNFIVGIGGLILTWAAQAESQKTSVSPDSSAVTLEDIQKQIKCLQKKCKRLESLPSQSLK